MSPPTARAHSRAPRHRHARGQDLVSHCVPATRVSNACAGPTGRRASDITHSHASSPAQPAAGRRCRIAKTTRTLCPAVAHRPAAAMAAPGRPAGHRRRALLPSSTPPPVHAPPVSTGRWPGRGSATGTRPAARTIRRPAMRRSAARCVCFGGNGANSARHVGRRHAGAPHRSGSTLTHALSCHEHTCSPVADRAAREPARPWYARVYARSAAGALLRRRATASRSRRRALAPMRSANACCRCSTRRYGAGRVASVGPAGRVWEPQPGA